MKKKVLIHIQNNKEIQIKNAQKFVQFFYSTHILVARYTMPFIDIFKSKLEKRKPLAQPLKYANFLCKILFQSPKLQRHFTLVLFFYMLQSMTNSHSFFSLHVQVIYRPILQFLLIKPTLSFFYFYNLFYQINEFLCLFSILKHQIYDIQISKKYDL